MGGYSVSSSRADCKSVVSRLGWCNSIVSHGPFAYCLWVIKALLVSQVNHRRTSTFQCRIFNPIAVWATQKRLARYSVFVGVRFFQCGLCSHTYRIGTVSVSYGRPQQTCRMYGEPPNPTSLCSHSRAIWYWLRRVRTKPYAYRI